MNKYTFVLIPVIALVLSACNILSPNTATQAPDEPEATEVEDAMVAEDVMEADAVEGEESMEAPGEPMEGGEMTYTLTDVAEHATPEDCWLALEGKVYDVSNFAPQHPGEEAVYLGCGKDATEMFNDRPNGSGAHSDTARSFLPNFYIGELSQ